MASEGLARVFEDMTEDDIQALKNGVVSRSTMRANQQIERSLDAYDVSNNVSLKELDKDELCRHLQRFMAGYRTINGAKPKLTTISAVWHALCRVLLKWSGQHDLKSGPEFAPLRDLVTALSKDATADGRGSVKNKAPMTPSDLSKLRDLFNSPRTLEDPTLLQYKFFLDIQTFHIRRGCESLREMTKDTFKVVVMEDGTKAIVQVQSLTSKNYQGATASTVEPHSGYIPEIDHPYLDPVKGFEVMLSKLHPDIPELWQRPLPHVQKDSPVWFAKSPVGERTLSTMCKRMCERAGITTPYTNHCLRATAIVGLTDADVSDRAIVGVSNHRSVASLQSYDKMTAESKKSKERISTELAKMLYAETPKKSTSKPDLPLVSVTASPVVSEPPDDALPGTSYAGAQAQVDLFGPSEAEQMDPEKAMAALGSLPNWKIQQIGTLNINFGK